MKNYFFTTIILSMIFGLGAGLAGYILGRYYISYDLAGFSLTREFDLMDGGSNLIIRDARKVIINQDDKSSETIDRVRANLLSVVELKSDDNFLNIDKKISQAIALTNDGWLLTIIPNSEKYKLEADLRIIDKDRNVYLIEDYSLAYDDVFFIKVSNLKNSIIFNNTHFSNLKAGQLLISFGINGDVSNTFLAEKNLDTYIFSSDSYARDYTLVDDINEAFVFNITGDFVGLVHKSHLNLASIINSKWLSLIVEGEVRLPSLGISYLDLSKTIFLDGSHSDKGVLIYQNPATSSAAFLAGLRKNDVILRINGQELNQYNNLSTLILQQSVKDQIYLVYFRDGKEVEVSFLLSPQKNEN